MIENYARLAAAYIYLSTLVRYLRSKCVSLLFFLACLASTYSVPGDKQSNCSLLLCVFGEFSGGLIPTNVRIHTCVPFCVAVTPNLSRCCTQEAAKAGESSLMRAQGVEALSAPKADYGAGVSKEEDEYEPTMALPVERTS